MQQIEMKTNKKSSWTPYGLLIVFTGPLVFATLLFAFNNHFKFNSVCTGKLITPPIASQALPFHKPSLLGKWQMVYVKPTDCKQSCEEPLIMLNTIHTALGKERERVTTRHIQSLDVTDINNPIHLEKGGLFVIDPTGWVILHYPSLSNPKGILSDVRRLLRLSHVG